MVSQDQQLRLSITAPQPFGRAGVNEEGHR
jgi:hypothetical protein